MEDRGIEQISAQRASLKRKRDLLEHQIALEQEVHEYSTLQEQLKKTRLCSATHNLRVFRVSPISLLIERTRHAPIFDLLFNLLGIKDVISLTRVCKALSTLYTDSIPRHWNIDKRLSRFVDDPKDFRHLLALNHALIVGSLPLQFFSRLEWETSSLDILVEYAWFDERRSVIEDYLAAQGYRCSEDSPIALPGTQLTKFESSVWSKEGAPNPTIVKVFESYGSTIHSFLTGTAFSTAHACFISWDSAYCLFPECTFIDESIKFLAKSCETYDSIITRYSQRGWKINDRLIRHAVGLNDKDSDPLRGLYRTRRIGDSNTWMIPLDCNDMRKVEPDRSVFERCTYRVSSPARAGSGTHNQVFINAEHFECCMLRHDYTSDGTNGSPSDWYLFLRHTMCRLASIQIRRHLSTNSFSWSKSKIKGALKKIDGIKKDRVSADHCPLIQFHWKKYDGAFEHPEDWEFADHLIPQIFEQWKKQKAAEMDE